MADLFPSEMLAALAGALEPLGNLGIPLWSRKRLASHVVGRAEWPKRFEWEGHLQQIVLEWQSEQRQALSQALVN